MRIMNRSKHTLFLSMNMKGKKKKFYHQFAAETGFSGLEFRQIRNLPDGRNGLNGQDNERN